MLISSAAIHNCSRGLYISLVVKAFRHYMSNLTNFFYKKKKHYDFPSSTSTYEYVFSDTIHLA